MGGYTGKVLWVDLERGIIREEGLPAGYARQYMGGSGLGARLLWDLLGEGFGSLDPLAPENPLIFMTGPLTGTPLPAVGRLSACTKSPLTGTYTESSVGGFLGAALKMAGYDGLVITGKAARPCCLKITPAARALQDAGPLWGQDTYEACRRLLEELAGEKGIRAAAAIGPAGENQVPFAAVAHNRGHFLGRTGFGAVFGAKNLKGLAIAGKTPPPLAHPERVRKLAKSLQKKMAGNLVLESLKAYGTNSGMDLARFSGDVPIKNWTVGEWDQGLDRVNGPAFDAVLLRGRTCFACPVACKREVAVREGPFQMEAGPGPEYETVASFGTLCLVDSVEALSKINEACNRLGLDTISAGALLAMVMEGLEKGLIPSPYREELKALAFGEAGEILKLLENIAHRRGIGDLLARGSRHCAGEWGLEDLLTTVKGLEAPMHDPRAGHGLGLAYATSYRGACHMADLTMPLEMGTAFLPSLALPGNPGGQDSRGKAGMVVKAQDLGSIVGGAAIFCMMGFVGFKEEDLLESLEAVTGRTFTLEELLHMGRRQWTLKRCLNNLCGLGSRDDALPPRLLTPLEDGAAAGSVPDMETMLQDFYRLRRLTPAGIPEEGLLRELDLSFLIPALR